MTDSERLGWRDLGRIAPGELVESRLQLHWAAQTVSAVAASLLAPRADDSQRSLEWHRRHGALSTQTLPEGHRAGLRLRDLIVFTEQDGEIDESFPFDGHSLEDGFAWWRRQLEGMGTALLRPLAQADWDMPEHRTRSGDAFDVSDAAGLAEMSRYFENVDLVLQRVADREVGASPVRCWPHHFDIATLIGVDADEFRESSRSIGVGLSPGDTSYAEPYFYANPWPRPKEVATSPLPSGGRWHREGWLGAVLTASQVVGSDDEADQQERVEAFLAAAILANKELLGF